MQCVLAAMYIAALIAELLGVWCTVADGRRALDQLRAYLAGVPHEDLNQLFALRSDRLEQRTGDTIVRTKLRAPRRLRHGQDAEHVLVAVVEDHPRLWRDDIARRLEPVLRRLDVLAELDRFVRDGPRGGWRLWRGPALLTVGVLLGAAGNLLSLLLD